MVAAHYPQGIAQFFLRENLGRFFHGYGGHREAWFYYIVVLVVGAFPWIVSIFRTPFMEDAPKGWGFMMLWFLGTVAFFSMSQSKSPQYILPAFVPLSILLGQVWTTSSPRETPVMLGVLFMLAPLGLLLWGVLPISSVLLAGLLVAGLMLVLAGGLGSKEGGFMLTSLMLFSLWVVAMGVLGPVNRLQSQKGLAGFLASNPVNEVYFHKTLSPTLLYYLGVKGELVEDPEHALERPLVLDLKRYLKHPYWWSKEAVVWGKKIVILEGEIHKGTIADTGEEYGECRS
jgi:4-amino-4-deoxy-L-arabinose transferase-like glycosyltransferase